MSDMRGTAIDEKREFVYTADRYNNVLSKYQNTELAIFFDIGETGTLDILLVVYDVNLREERIKPLLNNYDKDAFFIKARVVNAKGVKNDFSYSGATVRAIFTDLDDEKYSVSGS